MSAAAQGRSGAGRRRVLRRGVGPRAGRCAVRAAGAVPAGARRGSQADRLTHGEVGDGGVLGAESGQVSDRDIGVRIPADGRPDDQLGGADQTAGQLVLVESLQIPDCQACPPEAALVLAAPESAGQGESSSTRLCLMLPRPVQAATSGPLVRGRRLRAAGGEPEQATSSRQPGNFATAAELS